MSSNEVKFTVQFDSAAWAGMDEDERSQWIDRVTAAINDEAYVSAVEVQNAPTVTVYSEVGVRIGEAVSVKDGPWLFWHTVTFANQAQRDAAVEQAVRHGRGARVEVAGDVSLDLAPAYEVRVNAL